MMMVDPLSPLDDALYKVDQGALYRQQASANGGATAEKHAELFGADADDGRPHGDRRESLYAELRPLVAQLTRRYGDDERLREDLPGEIYCQFCALLTAYDPSRGVPLKPYLIRRLTDSVYTHCRSQWRRRRHEVSYDALLISAGTPAPSDRWDDDIIMKQMLVRLPKAIAQLPLRQRQVVIWRYYEERTFEEIAETLGVKAATPRSLLRHGLNNLRRWIQDERLQDGWTA